MNTLTSLIESMVDGTYWLVSMEFIMSSLIYIYRNTPFKHS